MTVRYVPIPADLDRSDAADAKRFRWLGNGNGYFLEEEMIAGHLDETDQARASIDLAMKIDAELIGDDED